MRTLLLILILILFVSCKEEEVIYDEYSFVIEEKVILHKKYFIKSTNDTVLRVSDEQLIQFNVGDTIRMGYVTEGFFKGEHFLVK